jgi:hypothetical protein
MDETTETRTFRAVIMAKEDLLALLGLAITDEGARVVRFDPRSTPPHNLGPYEEARKVRGVFRRSLETSRSNGWEVVYDGPPLFG